MHSYYLNRILVGVKNMHVTKIMWSSHATPSSLSLPPSPSSLTHSELHYCLRPAWALMLLFSTRGHYTCLSSLTFELCLALERALGPSNIPPGLWGRAPGLTHLWMSAGLSSTLEHGRYLKNVCCTDDWMLHPFLRKSPFESWSRHTQIRSQRQGRT